MVTYKSYETKKSELYDLFEKAVRNRKLLCNDKGQLRKENKRYKVAYQHLLSEVFERFADLCSDQTVRFFYWPDAEDRDRKYKEITDLWLQTSGQVIAVIKNGTFNELTQLEDYFVDTAMGIFLNRIRLMPQNTVTEVQTAGQELALAA